MRSLLWILALCGLVLANVGASAAEPPPTNDLRAYAGLPTFRGQSDAPDQTLTPLDIERAYHQGFVGVVMDAPGEPDWAREAARQAEPQAAFREEGLFSHAFPDEWRGIAQNVDRAVYWNYAMRFHGDPLPVFSIQQTTGNCVAAAASDVSLTHCYGVAIFLLGRAYEWSGPGSTVHYAFRGHSGQGAHLTTLAAAYQKHGFAARTQYAGYDLRDSSTDQRLGQQHWRDPERSLASLWTQTAAKPIGRVAQFDGGLPELLDLLAAGGSLKTGSRITATRDGRPISRAATIGPHAQSIIGYDNSAEMRSALQVNEPIFFFSQTWGPIRYVQSGWRNDWWGQPPQGVFILPWSVVRSMIPRSIAYWPDLTGKTPSEITWN